MHKTLKIAAAVILLGACLNSATAQTQKTITFGSSKSTGSSSKNKKGKSSHSRDYGQNTLTIGIMSYLDGFTAVSYERMVNDFFTVSAGAGITHKNYWMQIGDLVSVDNPGAASANHDGPNQSDVTDEYGNFNNRKPKMGTYFCVAPKFYPRHESLDGAYIAPLVEFRNYRWDAFKASESVLPDDHYIKNEEDGIPRSTEKVSENVRCLDISAIWGGHYQLSGHVVLGYYAGLGLRSIKANRLDLGYERVGDDEYRYTNSMVSYTDTRWLAQVGFSIGGWW